jgi:aspartate-semialdehyde dehydrogenase
LIVPLVNTSHFDIVAHQKKQLSLQKGFIITNANCSTTGLVVPLKAIEDAFGPLEAVICTTMQAISGGGYPGVPSLDIMDNVVPFIKDEEEKIEWEASKILGGLSSDATSFDLRASQPLKVSASCNRVPVIDGHMESASIKFSKQPPPSPEQVEEALRKYTCEAQTLGCPSAPQHAIYVHSEEDRPQPRLDRYFQDGAGVSVGRVRKCPVFDIKFTVLSNNVSIGAATSSIINAEYAVLKGIVP